MIKKSLFIILFLFSYTFAAADKLEYEKATYTGETFYGDPHGRGTMNYNDGETYSGQWKFGLEHGRGKVEYKNGDVYAGQWKEGRQNGKGVYTYAGGAIYTGMFLDGLFEGEGVLEYADGRKFVGTFKDDYKYEGKMTLDDGTIVEGIYPKEGKTDGKYNITYTDGSTDVWTYENGEFVE